MKIRSIPFGYALENGEIVLHRQEAQAVNDIFSYYLQGSSPQAVADIMDIPYSVASPDWSKHKVKRVLDNPRYTGLNGYPALVSAEDYEAAQRLKTEKNVCVPIHISKEMTMLKPRVYCQICGKRIIRKQTRTEHGKYSGKYALSELIVCGDCGAHYRRVTWARNGIKRVVWRCISRLEQGTKYCKESPTIDENRLHDTIVDAFNRLAEDKDDVLAVLRESLRYALESGPEDGPDIQAQIRERQEAMMKLVSDSIESGMEQNDGEFKRLSDEIRVLQDRLAAQKKTASDIQNDRSGMDATISLLEEMEHYLPEYDDALTRQMVERVTVKDDGAVTVRFKVGAEYECRV